MCGTKRTINFLHALFHVIIIGFINRPTLATVLTWKMNTNFNNTNNWIAFDGASPPCSKNIYSFPLNMEPTVISFPSYTTIAAKNILFPINSYFVFQDGLTIFNNLQNDTCEGTELKFNRNTRANWFDANNWMVNGTVNTVDFKAIPHAERVPCQYDSVLFLNMSSFHINISSNVAVSKMYLGNSELAYNDVAFLMATKLGKIQFLKNAETTFDLSKVAWQDSDDSVCVNYRPDIKYKICSVTECKQDDAGEEDECSNPFSPFGFCCPICGFHLKIEHKGNLHLIPVRTKLESLVKSYKLDIASTGLESQVGIYATRYARKFVHIVFILRKNGEKEKRRNVRKLIDELQTFFNADQQVVSTKLSHSWGKNEWNPTSDELGASGGLSGGIITLIIFIIILCGTFVLIYFWNKRGNAPISLNSILARVPSLPTLPSLPNFGVGNIGATARGSFGFARFSNERVSTINIGQRAAGSSLERAEEVDTETKPIDSSSDPEKSGLGYTDVTYDIIGIGGNSQANEGELEKAAPSKLSRTNEIRLKNIGHEKPEDVYDLVDVSDDRMPILGGMPSPAKNTETTEE